MQRILALLSMVLAPTLAEAELARLPMVVAGGLEARSAALVLSGQQGGGLDLGVYPLPLPDGTLALWLDIDPADLPAPPDDAPPTVPPSDRRWLFEIHVYALGPAGELAFFTGRAVAVDPRQQAPALAGGRIHAALRLDIPASLQPADIVSLRVLWLERRSERFGLRALELGMPRWNAEVVTPPGDDGLETLGYGGAPGGLLTPLAVAEPDSGLLLLGDGERPVPFPYGFAGHGWVPRRPDLASVGSTRLLLVGQGLGERVDVRWLDEAGGEVARHEGLMSAPEPGTVDGELAGLEVRSFDLPAVELAPGRYRLRVETAGHGAELAVRQARPAGEAPALAEAPESSKTQRSDVQRMAMAYRAAIEPLGRGDLATARSAVARFEHQALANADRSLPLMALELAVAKELGASDRRSLIPLMVLHEGLYRQSHRVADYQLATHSRTLVARLTEELLEKQGEPMTQRLVADLLTSQAGYLLSIGSTLAARNALRAALEHDAESGAALLLIAAIDEALGDAEAASRWLEILQRSSERSHEGGLRLAINRRRLGDGETAEALLRQSLGAWDEAEPAHRLDGDTGPTAWISAVAHQELARLLLADGRGDEALALLRSAVRRFPDQQRPVVQLAATLEQLGQGEESRRLLRALDLGAQSQLDTPRLIYSRWPLGVLGSVRQRLEERLHEAAPGLVVALAGDTDEAEVRR